MAIRLWPKRFWTRLVFPVPAGAEFANKDDALRYYGQIANSAIVVKPKSTNFGLGISIFQESTSLSGYEKALDIAFSEDSHVLVEEFVAGTEYRFFILDGKCEAVVLRVAANVVGDGSSSIRELVEKKKPRPSAWPRPSLTSWNHQSGWYWITHVGTAGLHTWYSLA